MNIYTAIQGLTDYAMKCSLITEEDVFAVRNLILDILHISDWENTEGMKGTIGEILDRISSYACENGIIQDTPAQRDMFDTKIMGVLTPFPREVNLKFQQKYSISPKTATDWYYNFSRNLNYVRAERIARDIKWSYASEYGKLEITINRSKPEKDPSDIAAEAKRKNTSYPKCRLCAENMGYAGSMSAPAKQNLRPVSVNIFSQKWYIQYSPYGYFNEHCIVFNSIHTPMITDSSIFEKLLSFAEKFPHYTIGSNADLPIVGGSILSHEHFQGGDHDFPLAKARTEKYFYSPKFSGVSIGLLKWPMSVIRVVSSERSGLINACSEIFKKWTDHSDENSGIYAATNGIRHNTITVAARIRNEKYECDIILRNNLTSADRPLGIFHPAPSLHHIKKENIGVIEAMGLAVLPSRLADELEILKNAMLEKKDISSDQRIAHHAEWAEEILKKHPEFSEDNATEIIREETGSVFVRILEDSGVFKRDENGRRGFERFIGKVAE